MRSSRFSNASFSSIATLLPQYTHSVLNISEDLEQLRGCYELPAYAPSSSDGSSSSSLSPAVPPRYSMLTLPQSSSSYDSTSPTLGDSPHQFRYAYPIRSKKPWATLHLNTRDAIQGNPKPLKSRPGMPRFWGCEPVAGALELNLESPQNIHQISISVRWDFTSLLLYYSTYDLGRLLDKWEYRDVIRFGSGISATRNHPLG